MGRPYDNPNSNLQPAPLVKYKGVGFLLVLEEAKYNRSVQTLMFIIRVFQGSDVNRRRKLRTVGPKMA
jgi:hypothetical protein